MDSWQTLVLSVAWLGRIDRLAERRFGAGGLAEEAAAFVIERLSENDWSRCRAYRGGASRDTFLHTLVNNCLEEFSRQRFGRVRPPEWLKREGPLWVELWRKLCMERQPLPVVRDAARCGGRDGALVDDVIRTIRARLPWCGQSRQEIPLACFEDEDGEAPGVVDALASDDDAAAASRAQQYEMALLALGYAFGDARDAAPRIMDARACTLRPVYAERFAALGATLELSDEERLCLRLVYQDGVKKNEVGRLLGIPAHQPGRILKRVFERAAEMLERVGIDPDVLIDAMSERD